MEVKLMKIIGLTGGSGTGKGTVAARMRALGAGWVDADAVYRTLCAENREMLSALDTAFGGVTDANGVLDRPKLAKIVFSDPAKLQQLNEITTPYIRKASLDAIHAQSACPIVLYDAPTLFEAGADDFCDKIIAVLAPHDTRVARITCDFLGLKPGDSALLCMSLDYIAGKMVVVRSIERHLHLISVSPSGHPLKNIDLKDVNGKDVNGEITFAAMVPMQVYNTLQVPEERERLTHIRHLIIGGGAIDAALEQELRSLPGNIAIWSTYGMTETLSHIALRRINGDEASEWYQPFDSVKISQTDEGCLVIDAPLVCAETLVTNDIVEIEPYIYNKVEKHDKEEKHDKVEKLRFRIKGRKDNVICSGGIKIQIEEVEALLKPHLEMPFMIAKKKDEKFGEIAVLLTEDEDLKKVEATIRRLLSGKSDDSNKSSESKSHKYWIPREFRYVDHLPLTETGKPKRSILL